MLRYATLFLCAFLATASITSPTLEKNLFFVKPNNKLSYQLFQTRSGIIAYSLENSNASQPDSYSSQYVLIDLQSNATTVILTDIMKSCNQTSSFLDRLHYHVATSTLVYYCTSNNSLLVLDEEDFSVQRTVSTGITAIFDEVKLTTDGYSIAILGMANIFAVIPPASQLILVSMQTYEVGKHIVFDHGLKPGEIVTGYASNSKGSYIVANSFELQNPQATVYSMFLIESLYELTSIFTTPSSYLGNVFSEFFAVGNLLFTNSLQELMIIDTKGNLIDTMPNLAAKSFQSNTFSRVAVVSEYGSTDLYAQFTNNSIIKISVNDANITTATITTSSDMQYVAANMTSNSLLFTLDSIGLNFTITDLVTSQTLYTILTSYERLLLTNSTFCFVKTLGIDPIVYIFASETNALIATVPINNGYYYDQEQSIVSFISNTGSSPPCELNQVDLLTGDVFVSSVLNTTSISTCPFLVLQVMYSGHEVTQLLVINDSPLESYSIQSQTFGLVEFVPAVSENGQSSAVVVDYDSMTVYYFVGFQYQETNQTAVFVYGYDSDSQGLTIQNSVNYTDMPFMTFFPIQDLVLMFPMNGAPSLVGTITVPSLSEAQYPFSQNWYTYSDFQDNSGNTYIILAGNSAPGILYSGQIQSLPEANEYTVSAQGWGLCSYSILDGIVTSFGLVRVYNICSDDAVAGISA